jgi:hypothetical protein
LQVILLFFYKKNIKQKLKEQKIKNKERKKDRGEVGEKGGRSPFFPYTIFIL